MFSRLFNLRVFTILTVGGLLTTGIMALGIYFIIVPKLPSIDSLRDVQFQVPLRVFSRDGKLIAEFGEKKRTPMTIDETPQLLIDAVLSAEDDRFYEHPGVDYKGMFRAVFYLMRTGEKGLGGSTITMQVARNFFLSREKTYLRKLNEVLLALKIERHLSKKEILELYLNKIYLGNRAYGFAAAAQVYYGKDPHDLTPAQAAMIAGLPKAPSAYNPIVNPKRALLRRNYVLNRMYELGHLTYDLHQAALKAVDDARMHGLIVEVDAPYVAEMVRAEIVERFGGDAYTAGYQVYTSIDGRLQTAANHALRNALRDYDERHGYRGPEGKVTLTQDTVEADWDAMLAEYRESNDLWPALVIEMGEKTATLYQPQFGKIHLDWDDLSWASPWRGDGMDPGAEPHLATEVLSIGDIVRIVNVEKGKWRLTQVPTVEGALVSLSPKDGAILALVGGFDFTKSNFNRVIQAERQPGSNLKPFNYSAALERGFTAASLINDAPVVFEDPALESTWRPENYSGKVFGPTRLREALVNSRNLVSIRLLNQVGIPFDIEYLQRFGFRRASLPRDLSLALGSAAITPLELVTGYAAFANGGYKITPYFLDRVESPQGELLYRANPPTVCDECEENTPVEANGSEQPEMAEQAVSTDESASSSAGADAPTDGVVANTAQIVESLPAAKRIVSAQNVYIMTTIMRDVIRRGTGRRAMQLGRNDLAGKTGTTNDQRDAWFSGFNPEVVTTAWVGFDTPKTLGERETGGRAALPMWIDYMREALKGLPQRPQKQPPGLVTVRIDRDTGKLVGAGDSNGIFEIFRADQVPDRMEAEDRSDFQGGGGSTTTPSDSGGSEQIPDQLF